jgi:hypothetical protein
MKYGIYRCKTDEGLLAYIGSSSKELEQLEWNHRNFDQFRNGFKTKFRDYLKNFGKNWVFEWEVEPYECTVKEIEKREGELIRALNPLFNVDKDPVKSSISYGRYD